MPDLAFPLVGPLGLGSPPSRSRPERPRPAVLCLAKTARCPSQGASLVAGSPIPCPLPHGLCSSRLVARGESSHPTPGLLVNRYPSSSGGGDKETAGSLQFPNYPCEYMPRSQTPVVSHPLGLTGIGLLPSGRCKPSAFPLGFSERLSCWTTIIPISGFNHAACTLATPGSIPPLTGTHAGSLLTWCLPLVRSELF